MQITCYIKVIITVLKISWDIKQVPSQKIVSAQFREYELYAFNDH